MFTIECVCLKFSDVTTRRFRIGVLQGIPCLRVQAKFIFLRIFGPLQEMQISYVLRSSHNLRLFILA